ncbi:unnamed protein product, partial [Ectocarpus fasciculatus]
RLVLLSSLAKPDLTPVVRFKVEKHEPRWAKRVFLKEASFAHHWSVMARTKIALSFDTTDEV